MGYQNCSMRVVSTFLLAPSNSSSAIVYSVITELPAVFLLYDSAFWCSAYVLFLFAVSVWNGGGFYIEVFGRKYVLTHQQLPQNANCAPQV